MIDAGLDRLHELVETRLAGHPALGGDARRGTPGGREPTGRLVRLSAGRWRRALAAVAREDEAFGQAVTELAAFAGARQVRQPAEPAPADRAAHRERARAKLTAGE